ncbi:hypothetical protein DUNSADRAFT_10217 [Dunaliella salina]|uniref:Phosphodiesterase n=1 Tax=Dunaliella salina TaxID=3046 RepID=A0ABQ7GFS4_DUNSA|nr:hypothetical protein DUNSADRAFT_10217 [Dunaliella salina]|eukprot:KAF5833462.1 hypothetical protein DUNSADRAFT_10217 [Dunaliella salina]
MVHGLLHSTFERFLLRVYGVDCHEKIAALDGRQPLEAAPGANSGCRPQHFEEKCPYADSLFFSHVRSTALVVHASEENVLYQYGHFFLQNAAEQGFCKLLSSFSNTFPGFLANLNNLHLHLSLGIPTLQTPDFRVEKVTSTSLELHYRSVRPGLGPMVEGLVHALAEFFFHDLPITMTWLKGRANNTCDHEVWHVTFPEDTTYTSHVDQLKQAKENAVFAADAATFYHLHPYHFVLDTDCRVIQAGSVLQRIMPTLVHGSRAADHFDIVAPLMCPHSWWTFKEMALHTELCFLLKGRTRKLEMKGQFVRTRLQPTAFSHTCSSHATNKSGYTTQGYPACPTFARSSGQGTPAARSLSITAPVTRPRSTAKHHLPYATSLSALCSEPQNGAQLTRTGSHGMCPVASPAQTASLTDLVARGESLPRPTSEPRRSPSGSPRPLPTSTSNASSRSREEVRKGNPFKRAYQSMTGKPLAAPASSNHRDNTARPTNEESPRPYHLRGSVASNGNKSGAKESHEMRATSAPQHVLPSTVSNGASVHGTNVHHMYSAPLSNPLDRTLPEPLPCAQASADAGQEVLLFVGTPRMLNLDEMRAYGMMLDDIPMHDMTADVLVMSERIEADNLLRKRLQEERAVLEERAELLAAQNAAQEEAYLRMGEALEEALIQRDENQGAPKYKGFHVETPAEKALELLDKILHGIHPGMREVLEVRDSILMAGTDLRVPLRLEDQVVQELGQSTPVDTEVAAALTQLLAAGGPGVSRWSVSESSDTASSEPEEALSSQNNARPTSGNNLGFSAFNRAFSSTLETFKRPFAGGQDSRRPSRREKKRTTASGVCRLPSRRLTESLMLPLVGSERTSKLQHSRSTSRTGTKDGGDRGSRPPVRRSSSFSAGENTARLEREVLLQQLHEQVQQRSSAGAAPLIAAASTIRSSNAPSSLLAERVHELLSTRPSSRASGTGTSTSTSMTQAHIGHNPTGTSFISSRASDRPLHPHCSSASATPSTTQATLECPGSPAPQTSAPPSSNQVGSTQGDHAGASESGASLLDPAVQSGPLKLASFVAAGRSPSSTAQSHVVVPHPSAVASAPTSSAQWVHSLSGKLSAAQLGNSGPNLQPQRSFTGPLVPSSEVSASAGGGVTAGHRSASSASTGERVQVRVARRPPARSKSSLLRDYRALGAKQPIQEEVKKQPIQEELKSQPIQGELGRGHGTGPASSPASKKFDASHKGDLESSPQAGSPPQARESLIRKLSDGLSGLAAITDFGRAGKGAFVQALGARSSSKTKAHAPSTHPTQDSNCLSADNAAACSTDTNTVCDSRVANAIGNGPSSSKAKAHALSAQPAQDSSCRSAGSAAACSTDANTDENGRDASGPRALSAHEARRTPADDGEEGRDEAGESSESQVAGSRSRGPHDGNSDELLAQSPCPQHPAHHANAQRCPERQEFLQHQTSGIVAHEDGSSSAPLPQALCVKRPANSSSFLLTVEDRYIDNPYHNRIHAADVLRTLHVMMSRGGIRQAMHSTHDIALLAAYMAAVVHDLEHKGVNNDFLVKTLDPLALFYNDRSPMENHHASAAFRLLLWDEQCAAFANSHSKVGGRLQGTRHRARPDSLELLRPVGPISDMSGTPSQHPHTHHPPQQGHSSNQGLHLARPHSHESSSNPSGSLQGANGEGLAVQPQHTQGPLPAPSDSLPPPARNAAAMVMGPLSGNRLPPAPSPQQNSHQQGHKSPAEHLSSYANSLHSTMELNIVDEELRTLVLQMALKCADLGHLTHVRDVHRRWVLLLEEEMFRQGDAEKAHGLPASPLMDRAKGGISKSQAGFFSIVVLPQLELVQAHAGTSPG